MLIERLACLLMAAVVIVILPLSQFLSFFLSLSLSLSLSHSLTHSLTHSPTHSLTHSLSHTHAHIYIYTRKGEASKRGRLGILPSRG